MRLGKGELIECGLLAIRVWGIIGRFKTGEALNKEEILHVRRCMKLLLSVLKFCKFARGIKVKPYGLGDGLSFYKYVEQAVDEAIKKQYSELVDHKPYLENILDGMNIVIGNKKRQNALANKSEQLEKLEKFLDKFHSSLLSASRRYDDDELCLAPS